MSAPRDTSARTGAVTMLRIYLSGFLMGSADLVPGVSGGTIALVVGVYERLVANLRAGAGAASRLLRLDGEEALRRLRAVEWPFLLTLLAGVLTAVVALAGIMHDLLEREPVAMSGLFFGLIVGSVVITWVETEEMNPRLITVAAVAAAVTFLALGLRGGRFVDPPLAVFFLGGAVAVVAMILPGISGSFILLLLGLYNAVIAAIDGREIAVAATVALGAAVGLGVFSTFLHWLLRRWHDLVLAVLIGLMAGSLRVLWPWPAGPDGVGDTALGAPVAGEVPAVAALAAVAAVVVITVGALARRHVPAYEPTS